MAQVRTRKCGKTWSYIFEAGNINGKRKVVEKGGFPTKDAAYKAGVSAYTDFLHGNIMSCYCYCIIPECVWVKFWACRGAI